MYNHYFKNKIALVTGAGSGIGRAVCLGLAAAGAEVICTDIDLAKAQETAALILRKDVVTLKLDVTQMSEVEKALAWVATKYDRIDMVFNNAGIAVSGELRDINSDAWKRIIDVNLYGVLYGSQAAYQLMLKQGSGQIVNTASLAGLIDYITVLAPYAVTKRAVVAYTKILRMEAKAFGIKANVICPGVVRTPIGGNSFPVNAKQSWGGRVTNELEKGISADAATHYILKGVAANREVIVFPGKAKAALLFTRVFKGLFKLEMKRQLKEFRREYRVNQAG